MLKAQQIHKKVSLVGLVKVMFNNIFKNFVKGPKQLTMSLQSVSSVTVSLDGVLPR